MDTIRPEADDRCAYYGRVSTPKQKLEHQREHVFRFVQDNSIALPDERVFEDKEKRHKSDKREAFQRLLEIVRQKKIDWIIICAFDRWGVASMDEFFDFRRILIENDVKLWSVVDQLNLTGLQDSDFYRIVSLACAATRSMEFMAERNVLKMVDMAKGGWCATGNAPYGLDLVCYPLPSKNDTAPQPLFRVVRLRYKPLLLKIIQADGTETTSNRFPLRDKKATGYRLAPSQDAERLKAVNMLFEMYDQGMSFQSISRHLHAQGHDHYDKPFLCHAVETILSNSAYLGLPAWGKVGTGAYRLAKDKKPVAPNRKATDPVYVVKPESDYIYPEQPLFPPVVPPDLFQRCQTRLKERGRINPDYGKRRTRDRAKHPLMEKIVCPDCGQAMVCNSVKRRDGERERYFVCGTYRKFRGARCRPNMVQWKRADEALDELLRTVSDRIDQLKNPTPKALNPKGTEYVTTVYQIASQVKDVVPDPTLQGDARVSDYFSRMFEAYDRRFAKRTKQLQKEAEEIEVKIGELAELVEQNAKMPIAQKKWLAKIGELEARAEEIRPLLVPLTGKANVLFEQMEAIQETIRAADRCKIGKLLDAFVDRVIPRMVPMGGKKDRRTASGFEFVPRKTTQKVLPECRFIDVLPEMQEGANHMNSALVHLIASMFAKN